MKHFTDSHEWIQVSANKGTVGITDYAQNELGEIVYVELPKLGQNVKAGEEVCVLESTKAAADIYAPVSGKIIAVNERIVESPSLLNRAAETTAWLFQIELANPRELDHLLSEKQYRDLKELH